MFGKKEPAVVLVPVDRPRTQYVDRHVTIEEKRAPTDESVKLLREMEAKAEAEIVKAVQVSSQHFECVVHCALDEMSDQMRWRAIFKLNGKQMTAVVSVDRPERDLAVPFAKLRDEMAKVIAGEVLNDAFCAVFRNRFEY